MDSFSYYRCSLSSADVIQSPRSLSHALQLRLTYSHIRFITSDHRPQEVNPAVDQFWHFQIPQICVLFRPAACAYVSNLTWSMGFSLSLSELDSIVSCIYRGGAVEVAGGGSIVVEASVSLLRTDVFIGGDERSVIDSDETMIFDAIHRRRADMSGSCSSDVSYKNLSKNLKKMKIDSKEAGDVNCAICLEEFKDSRRNAIKTSCSHIFHHHCLKQWMRKKNGRADCPMCRAVINLIC